MMKVKVEVDGDFKSVIKHIAGGVDREVREVGPNEEVTFEFKEFMGDNLFIVSPPVSIEASHTEVQEEEKNANTREALDAKENEASSKSASDKNESAKASDDKSKAAEASKSSSSSSAKK